MSKNHVIPSQWAHWRGNLLEFQTFLAIIEEFYLYLGDCTPRAFPRFAQGTTPACGLVRNDILFSLLFLQSEVQVTNLPLFRITDLSLPFPLGFQG